MNFYNCLQKISEPIPVKQLKDFRLHGRRTGIAEVIRSNHKNNG
jgi:hypothetical protein